MTEALSADRLSFGYSGRPLLKDFCLTLARAEFAGLIGPNGAGKTTLLRLLTGVIPPDSGRVLVGGRDLSGLTPRECARTLAVVPQESRILFEYSVLEVVLMGRFAHLGMLGIESAKDVELARRSLAEMGMESHASRLLNELSSGERQRVLIARALAQEPEILLLDEPTSFLDLKHRLQIYDILVRLNRGRGMAILIISHDLNLAARHCRLLWLMRGGKIVAQGTPREVIRTEVIRDVYGTDAEVQTDPRTGTPFILPYPVENEIRKSTIEPDHRRSTRRRTP